MWYDVRAELIKLKAQKKNYIVLVGHFILMALIYLGFSLASFNGPMARTLRASGIELRDMIDAMFFARTIFVPTMLMIFPIFIATLAGDMIAGEMQDGSLKLYASRPRRRSSIVLSKFLALGICSLVYAVYFSLIGLAAGWLLFKSPGVQVIPLFGLGLATDFVIMPLKDSLLRYGAGTLYHAFSILALGSITLFFSTLFNRMTSATIAGVTLYFVSYIIGTIPVLSEIKPYLLTEAMNGSTSLWLNAIPTGRLIHHLSLLSLYTSFFTTAAVLVFHGKDIK